jgi:RHS repeat-associated protein
MYAYNEPSQLEPTNKNNRLSSTAISSITDNYGYDGSAGLHGNITSMSHLSSIQWDFQDRLRVSSKQNVANGGTPETTFYVYDLTGNRIRKVTERQTAAGATGPPTRLKERFYLSGYEVYRKYAGDGVEITLERVTLQIANATESAALVETRTQGTDGGFQRLVRFQLSNYLGSACVELDDQARIISYEEFYPYGGSSYQAVARLIEAPKRYRYTGKERDIETGFDYFGARYYASWIGRWCSPDSGGLIDGQNLYAYASLNPTTNLDRHGLETEGGGSGGSNGEREEPRGAHKKRKGKPGNEQRHSKGNRRRGRDQDKHDEAERKQQNDATQKKIEGDQELRDRARSYGIKDEEIPRGKLSDIQRTQLRNKIEKKRQKYGNDPTNVPRDPGAQNTAGADNQRPVTAPGAQDSSGSSSNQGNGVQAPGAPNPSGTANAPGAGGDKKDDHHHGHDGPKPPPIIAKPPNNQPPADPPNKGPPENTPTENRPAAPGTDGVQDGVKEPGGNNGGGSQNPGQGGNRGGKEEDRGGSKLPAPTPQQVQVGAWAVFLGVVVWIMRGLLIVAAA